MTDVLDEHSSIKYKIGKRRLLAAILDAIIVSVPYLVVTQNATHFENYTLVFWVAIIYPIIQISYSVLGHYYYGQTLAKSVLNIKVTDISESRKLTFKQAIYRDSVWILVEIGGFVALILQSYNLYTDSMFFNTVSFIANGFATWWFLLEVVTMFTNKKRRAIHDFLAGTVVIKDSATISG